MKIIFESHATTLDNEAGLASGWNDIALSALGEKQAIELGQRYKLEDFDAIFCSDLQRSYKTAKLAFKSISSFKLFLDWRLRECDYGDFTQRPKAEVEAERLKRIIEPFPNGISYQQGVEFMQSFLDHLRNDKTGFKQIMIIGSRLTQFGLEHCINGKDLETLVSETFKWQPGWEYELN